MIMMSVYYVIFEAFGAGIILLVMYGVPIIWVAVDLSYFWSWGVSFGEGYDRVFALPTALPHMVCLRPSRLWLAISRRIRSTVWYACMCALSFVCLPPSLVSGPGLVLVHLLVTVL